MLDDKSLEEYANRFKKDKIGFIERHFEDIFLHSPVLVGKYKGYLCLIRLVIQNCAFCGYVQFPLDEYEKVKAKQEDADDRYIDLECHGGVTYDEDECVCSFLDKGFEGESYRYVGFDCMHAGDSSLAWYEDDWSTFKDRAFVKKSLETMIDDFINKLENSNEDSD